jgi:hypothetical protein
MSSVNSTSPPGGGGEVCWGGVLHLLSFRKIYLKLITHFKKTYKIFSHGFWDVTLRCSVNSYRRFEEIAMFETSVDVCQSILRNVPEDLNIYLHCSKGLKPQNTDGYAIAHFS